MLALRYSLVVPIIIFGAMFSQAQSTESPTGPAAEAGESAPSRPIRVSQGITQGLIIHKVKPSYPDSAREKGIEGYVVLRLLIGKDGVVKDLHLVKGPQELADAATEAVRQWRFKPYYLNGQPQEIETTVTLSFP